MIIPWTPNKGTTFLVKTTHITRPHSFQTLPTVQLSQPYSLIRPKFLSNAANRSAKTVLTQVIPEAARKTFKDSWREDTKAILFTGLIALVLFSILEGQRWKGAVNEKISQLFHDKILRNQELAAALSRLVTEFAQQFTGNEQIQQDVSSRINEFVRSQGPALREALLKEVLHHPDFETAAVNWAKEQAITVCNDPVTVEAMADLITQATEMPTTQEAVATSLRDVIAKPEVLEYAVDFVSKTMSSPAMKEEMSKASRNAIDAIAQDPKVQSTLSNTLWSVMRKSMLPRWFWSSEDSPSPTVLSTKGKKSRRGSLVERAQRGSQDTKIPPHIFSSTPVMPPHPVVTDPGVLSHTIPPVVGNEVEDMRKKDPLIPDSPEENVSVTI